MAGAMTVYDRETRFQSRLQPRPQPLHDRGLAEASGLIEVVGQLGADAGR